MFLEASLAQSGAKAYVHTFLSLYVLLNNTNIDASFIYFFFFFFLGVFLVSLSSPGQGSNPRQSSDILDP